MFLGLILAAIFAVGMPQIASADIAAPVIVPAPDSTGIPERDRLARLCEDRARRSATTPG